MATGGNARGLLQVGNCPLIDQVPVTAFSWGAPIFKIHRLLPSLGVMMKAKGTFQCLQTSFLLSKQCFETSFLSNEIVAKPFCKGLLTM
jgi:hypothetical protein